MPLGIFALLALLAQSEQATGTRKMVELLERTAQNADPRENLYLNHERAAMTARELEDVRDEATRARGLYLLAPELLLSGDTAGAIETLEELDGFLAKQTGPSVKKLRRDIGELVGVAYLRLGEQQNCFEHGSADSCVLPIKGSGIHRNPEGSRRAIAQFEKILDKRPGNTSVRWLLNLAYMTLGEYPNRVPSKWRVNASLFETDYDIKPFLDVAFQLGLDVNGLAGGVVVEDLDRDGDLDLVCSSWGLRDPIRVFRNDGGTFTDSTEASGLAGITGGLNLVHADYDNDGREDILVLRGAWWGAEGRHPNSLLRNTSRPGELRFEDVTHASGLLSFHPTQTAAWADYDGDGWLDLFIGNESEPSELYRNNRDGTFTNVTGDAGLKLVAHVKAVAWGDFNNDNHPDLYISALGAPNRLYRNDGRGGFKNVAAEAGVEEPIASFPAWFFDYDNDGWLDLFVSGYSVAEGDYMELEHKGESPRLYRNRGNGTFADVTERAGLDRLSLTMGSNFGDLDNDGFLDFYLGTGEPDLRALVPNRMYRNDAGRRFQDVTTSGGFGHLQKGHGVAFADLDHDGDQDIYAVMGGAYSGDVYRNVLFENPGHGNHFMILSLEGSDSNRSAIGARIRVQVDSTGGARDIYATITTGGSFGSTSLRKTIGLGQATAVRELEVLWPATGKRQVFDNLPLDRWIVIEEGSSKPLIRNLEPLPFSNKVKRPQ